MIRIEIDAKLLRRVLVAFESYEKLLVAYRLVKRPSDKTLDGVGRAKKLAAQIKGMMPHEPPRTP